MDPQRFDSLAKRLGTSLSRRGALRAGAGAALGAVALSKLAPTLAQDADTTVKDRFISIRTYPYTGPIEAAAEGLKALVVLMEQQPGFISIEFVGGDNEIHVIATFLDKSTAVAAATLGLAGWAAVRAGLGATIQPGAVAPVDDTDLLALPLADAAAARANTEATAARTSSRRRSSPGTSPRGSTASWSTATTSTWSAW